LLKFSLEESVDVWVWRGFVNRSTKARIRQS